MTSSLAPTQGKPCRRTVGLPLVHVFVTVAILWRSARLVRSAGNRGDAELLERPGVIANHPVLDNLSPSDTVDGDPGSLEMFSRRRNPHERSAMRASEDETNSDQFPFRNHVLSCDAEIGEGGAKDTDRFSGRIAAPRGKPTGALGLR